MKEIVILSGKGGTGKTSIVGSLAALAQNKVLADCDVDAADLHLLLDPSPREENEFKSGSTALINKDTCIGCGKCEERCPQSGLDLLVEMSGLEPPTSCLPDKRSPS